MEEECALMEQVVTWKSVSSPIDFSLIGTRYTEISVKSPLSSQVLKDMLNMMLFGKQQSSNKQDYDRPHSFSFSQEGYEELCNTFEKGKRSCEQQELHRRTVGQP